MKGFRRALLLGALCVAMVLAAPGWAFTLLPGDVIVTDQVRASVVLIDPEDGSRLALSGCADAACSSTVGGGASLSAPTGLAREISNDPNASLFVTDTLNNSLLQIDPSTGFRTVISDDNTGTGPQFVSPFAVSVDVAGDLYVTDVGLNALLRVDPFSGNRTVVSGCIDAACSSVVGGGAGFSAPFDLALDAAGGAFVLDTDLQAVFSVDLLSGARSVVSSSGVGSGDAFDQARNVALDGTGGLLVSDSGLSQQSPGSIVAVDPLTGDRTALISGMLDSGRTLEVPVDVLVDGDELLVLDFSPGVLLGILPPDLDRILSEPADGGITLASPVHMVQVPIPEPGTLPLLALGCAALARRRRATR